MSIDREARVPAAIAALAAVGCAVWLPLWTSLLPLAALAFTLWFFRDPPRRTPQRPGHLICPADGKIIVAGPRRISVFMNVFNVHVCRTPVAGEVVAVEHHPGRFLAAFKPEAPEQNERTVIAVRDEGGATIRFTLIAGLVARRIVTRVRPGQRLRAGERVGLIRFGSRVDIDLPDGLECSVRIGDRVVAGESLLAAPVASAA